MPRPKPVVLVVADGWGVAPDSEGNAVTRAGLKNFPQLLQRYPAMTLRASGEEVGLSWGEMGNSEVGHLTIGAGKVLFQTLPRIDKSIESGEFYQNPALQRMAEHLKQTGGALHIMGILSSGKVHGMNTHAYALLEFAQRAKIKQVFVHGFLDGRDTLYNSAVDFVQELQEKMKKLRVGTLASVCGRYYAMDRDNRWDRVAEAYAAITEGKGTLVTDALTALKAKYAEGIFDEQMPPLILEKDGKPVAVVQDGDAVLYWNYRPDRARELTHAFTDEQFSQFPRPKKPQVFVATMAEYENNLPVEVLFPREAVTMPLARVVSEAGLKQLHIAETEKYAHVTFFFNGTKEEPFPGEERVIVPSPQVASYDKKPEMAAEAITEKVLQDIHAGTSDFIVLNFANPDMVAHSGNLEATKEAMVVTDACLGRIVAAVLEKDGALIFTADHGNAEEVLNLQTGGMDKEHSTNPVPCLIIGKQWEGRSGPHGVLLDISAAPPVGMLADIAPTVLKLLNIPQPPEMIGTPLI